MQLSPEQLELLTSFAQEWDRAEVDIKLAEQVCNDVVIPAIKELRYGGRRIADAIVKMVNGSSDKEVTALLHDARFDCHRARHDAIDAGTSKIAIDLDTMEKKLGYEVIIPVYPEFAILLKNLQETRELISKSRGNRENREAIYATLEAAQFPELVKAYNKLRSSEKIMKKMAVRKRWSEAVGIFGIVLAILALLFAWYTWTHPFTSA